MFTTGQEDIRFVLSVIDHNNDQEPNAAVQSLKSVWEDRNSRNRLSLGLSSVKQRIGHWVRGSNTEYAAFTPIFENNVVQMNKKLHEKNAL